MLRLRSSRMKLIGKLLQITVLVSACSEPAHIQPSDATNAATDVRVGADRGHPGILYARINNARFVIVARGVFRGWVLETGRKIAYSSTDGAGGYENEGQSLYIYNVPSKTSRKVLSALYVIDKVTEIKTRTGREALLVEMRDGGLGALHLAVVDPVRGATFVQSQVRLLACEDDMIVIGHYRETDWEHMNGEMGVKPFKSERYDIDALIRRPATVEPFIQ